MPWLLVLNRRQRNKCLPPGDASRFGSKPDLLSPGRFAAYNTQHFARHARLTGQPFEQRVIGFAINRLRIKAYFECWLISIAVQAISAVCRCKRVDLNVDQHMSSFVKMQKGRWQDYCFGVTSG